MINQPAMANLLALDTATEACSVALHWNGEIFHHFELCPREHTQKILPMIEQILAQAGVSLTQLDAIAFGQGPGSFTGVRIGVAAAQGLGFGANLPLLGVSTLAAMAQQAIEQCTHSHVIAAIDARMGEIYHAIYRNEQGIATLQGSEQVTAPDQLEYQSDLVACAVGTGWQSYPQQLQEHYPKAEQLDIALPRAYDMLKLANVDYQQGRVQDAESAQPVYLRDKVTWKKLPGRE
ncbi:tRNA (adenosine(37)-N6)-threonylcarbamoyltransferase complex dimerization subunit type 1 TsaB [Celerinatantimonas yamalensis]|uniref:tRNA threonylcarbamoyladenosine biosynthesis protein TsaB n=1 Tax=Celerinatantimonas yamalensis TaxID=559956 RepID=A0ABW9G2X1_9GAMM